MKTFSRAFSCANAKAPALPRVSPFFLPIGSLFILWKSGFKVQTNAHYLRDNVVLLRMRLKIHSCVAVSCCECYSMSWSLCITGKMGVKFIIWGKRYSNFHLIITSLSVNLHVRRVMTALENAVFSLSDAEVFIEYLMNFVERHIAWPLRLGNFDVCILLCRPRLLTGTTVVERCIVM